MNDLTLYKLSIHLGAEGWRKIIAPLEAHETDINIIYRDSFGFRRFIRKDQPLEVQSPIHPSHERIGLRIYCREDQIKEAARLIDKEMTKTINRIREEYTAMIESSSISADGMDKG